ncbi:MAG: DUF3108 domain-containing protein [Pseudomonadota bacterium]
MMFSVQALFLSLALTAAPVWPEASTPAWNDLFAVDIAQERLSPPPPKAVDKGMSYSVTYKGEIAGFDVGRIFLNIAASEANYEVGYRMEQRGIARWFSDAEARTTAHGSYDQGEIDAHYYFNHDFEREDDQQYVELYRKSGDRRLHLWTDPQYDFAEAVSESQALGALDPMAALMMLGFSPAPEGKTPCDRKVKVFDGRRLFHLQMIDEGTEFIRKGGKGRFEGTAYKCKLTQEKIAGYREKDKGDIEGDLWVYLADVPVDFRHDSFAYVPVMIVAKRGFISARLEGKNPMITAHDGRQINLGKR